MNNHVSPEEKEVQEVILPAILDVTSAESLLSILKESITANHLILVAENVEKLTTPCIQLLLATEKTLTANGHTLRINSPSDAFKHALCDLGLKEQFNQWSNA